MVSSMTLQLYNWQIYLPLVKRGKNGKLYLDWEKLVTGTLEIFNKLSLNLWVLDTYGFLRNLENSRNMEYLIVKTKKKKSHKP